jgi:hypothetical protein
MGSAMFAAMLLLTGCNVEEMLIDNSVPQQKGKLSFLMPLGGKKTVTYAQFTGTDAEYAINRLAIFWFKDATDVLYKRFSYGAGNPLGNSFDIDPIDVTAVDNTTVATIDVGEDDFASKFFIIANVNANSVMSSALSAVIPGTTTRAEFEQLMTDALAADTVNVGDIAPVMCPLPMALANGGNTPGGYVLLPSLTGQQPSVIMKRRVARFDVINNADFTNFTIKKIYVSRATKSAYLQDKPFDGKNSTIWNKADSTGKFVISDSIDGGSINFNGTRCVNKSTDSNNDGIPDEFQTIKDASSGAVISTPTRDSAERSKPAFYLYPTVLDSAYKKTEIVVEGKYGTVDRVYRLKLDSAQFSVEANKAYHIKIKRSITHEVDIHLTVAHWDDEVTAEWNGDDKDAVYSNIYTNANGKKDTLKLNASTLEYPAYEYSSADSVTLQFTVTGTAKDHLLGGVTATISFSPEPGTKYVESDLVAIKNITGITTVKTEMTYASQYKTDYLIKLPPTFAPLETVLKITNAANTDNFATIKLKSNNYAKTGFKPVKFKYIAGGVVHTMLWAPMNVGATDFKETPVAYSTNAAGEKYVGNVYQWGRNVAFKPYTGTFTTQTMTQGPVDSLTAAGTTNFINVASGGNDWRTTRNNDLWGYDSGDELKMRGPCPEGWRLPSVIEVQALNDSATLSYAASDTYRKFTIKANSGGGVLYVPISGFVGTDGSLPASNAIGLNGDYWTYTPGLDPNNNNDYKARVMRVQGNGTATSYDHFSRAYGFFIRAVRELD